MKVALVALLFTAIAGCGSDRVDSGQDGATPDGSSTEASFDGTAPSDTGTSDSGDAATVACKKGIAANTAPGPAFSPGVAWWYNWSLQPGTSPLEFVPMIWGAMSLGKPLPQNAKTVLGFNEPNFKVQSNLTPQQAAADWPMVEVQAKAQNALVASPAMNFCGPAQNCNGTSPYQYLKDFFAACPGCKVDYVAVHWYNCDLPSLKDYLEPGGNLEGFEQFGKPIWLTEFSCDGNASVAQQEAYMKTAVAYLESNPHVYRYAWFSADPIPNAKLVNGDGTPTMLGTTYIGLPSCP
jgi:hypothetical protein